MTKMFFVSALFASALPVELQGSPMKKVDKSISDGSSKVQGEAVNRDQGAASWNFQILKTKSLFAVVTRKAGLASALAHNHLVSAGGFEAKLTAHPNVPGDGSFSFRTQVAELEFDREDLQKMWFPTFKELGWLSEPYKVIKESDRKTIREHALAENQLNAAKFSEIEARVSKVFDAEHTVGDKRFSKKALVDVVILGRKLQREFSVNMNIGESTASVDAVGDFRFSEFGIRPYRALMGALGNQDSFHMIVHMEAFRER